MSVVALDTPATSRPLRTDGALPTKLKAEGLSKSYGPVVALDEMSITVREGEFLSLLGPSGSGKTTFLMMTAGLITPTSGALWINGKLSTYLPVQDRDIGMVFQSYALFPHLSVFENVAFPLRMRKHSETEIKAAVGSALEMIRLSHVSERLPRALSGGQQQRIALARCLVYKPSIILMDEPLGALDRKLREEMQLEIKRIHRATGTTLLYVTHDQDEAMTMSDRICLMKDGRIEHLGSPDELYFAPKTEFTADFLGSSNFIDAEVAGRDGERTVLSIAGGKTIKAVLSPACAGKKHIRVMIRPERTVLGPAARGSDANEVSGTVSDSILAGGFSRVYVDVPGIGVLASSYLTGAPEQAATPGTSQSLHWPVSATLTFPGKE